METHPVSASTRERILSAARRLFHERGFSAVGINTICSEAGAVKGSFYHFFAGKQDLLEAVLHAAGTETLAALRQAADPASDGRSRVVRHIGLALETASRQQAAGLALLGCPIGALTSELGPSSTVARSAAAAVLEQWRSLLVSELRAAVDDGSLAPSVDPEATAVTLLAVIQGMSTLGRGCNDPEMLRTVAQTAVKRLLPVGSRG